MKNLKIMSKLFILFIASSMIPLMIFAFITERSIETSMIAEIQKSNEIYATLTKENLTSFFEERKGDGIVQASNKDLIYYMKNRNNGKIDFQESINKSKNIKSQLKIMAEQYDYSDVFITDKAGKVIIQGVNGAIMGFDMKNREYMKKSLNGEQTWSELFFSPYYSTNIMVLSTPIKDGAEVIGTINFFVDQAILDRLVQEGVEKIGKSGDAYLINKDMMLLTNTKLGMYKENSVLDESKKIETEMGKSISANINNIDFEEAKTYSDYLGNTVLGVGRVIKFGEGDAGLIIEVDKSEAFKKVEDMKTFFIIFTSVMIIIGAVIAVLIARTITGPLKKILERFTKISELDLSQKVPEELQDRKDEIGDIAKSMSLVQKNIREAIAITGEASQQLAASSEELTAICSETAEVSESFSHNVTSISEGAVDQAGSIEKGTKVTEDIGNLIDTNTDKLSQLNGVSEKMTREVNEGKETINTLIKMTEKNGQVANKIGAVIENTNRSAERIGEASKLISSIADQTNLLALNAAIESARAGEAGRGFSVVADEIRKLAEQSSESTLVIEKMLSELLENVIAAVDGIFVVKNTVDEQIQAVKVTEEKYAEIEESIKITIDELKDLIENGYVIEEKKDMVMNIMRSLTEIAEENVSSTEQAHAATEEQVASLNNIAESATALSELSEELQGSFAKFKL